MEHTADIRMQVEGDTLAELFRAALLGMDELLSPGICNNKSKSSGQIQCEISVVSSDATALIVDFLSEVLTYAYEKKTVFCKIDFQQIGEKKLKARIYGKKVSSFAEDIKAVTYHEAQVRKNEKGNWETLIIFDI